MRGVLVLVAVAACWRASATAVPPTPPTAATPLAGPPWLIAGEAFEFGVSLRGIAIGHVQVAIGEPGWKHGRRAIVIKSRGQTEETWSLLGSLRWELTTTLALDDATTIDELEESWIEAAGKSKHLRWERGPGGEKRNIHAAGAALRGWRPQLGDATRFTTVVDHVRISVELRHTGSDVIGMTPAVRYDGIARGKYRVSIWVSDDVARVPLRLRSESRWGEIGIDLVEYTPPKER
jgi:hypothetical protein